MSEKRTTIESNMGYKAHQIPAQRCEKCYHSYVTNPGAYRPGLACKIMEVAYKLTDEYGNDQVHPEAYCNFFVE